MAVVKSLVPGGWTFHSSCLQFFFCQVLNFCSSWLDLILRLRLKPHPSLFRQLRLCLLQTYAWPCIFLFEKLSPSDATRSSATSAGTAAPSLSAPQQEDQHIYTPIRLWRRCNLGDNLTVLPLQFLDSPQTWECTRAMISDVWNQRKVFP